VSGVSQGPDTPTPGLDAYFQVGIAVDDLEAAMAELGSALGVSWRGPEERDVGDGRIRVAFADSGPPYLELIEGPPGSIWDAAHGTHLHHLGYWSDDLAADAARLEAGGVGLELDLGHARYHRSARSPIRIELIDSAHRAGWLQRWGFAPADAGERQP
jgi:hypothetical protein